MYNLQLKDIKYLVGSNVVQSKTLKPFENIVCSFLKTFQKIY